ARHTRDNPTPACNPPGTFAPQSRTVAPAMAPTETRSVSASASILSTMRSARRLRVDIDHSELGYRERVRLALAACLILHTSLLFGTSFACSPPASFSIATTHSGGIEMTLYADIALEPGGIIAWLLVGLIAGWLAGTVMRGGGYGIIGDIVVGLVGAFIGGFLFGFVATGMVGFVGSIIVAFLGACVLIMLLRLIAPGRTRI